MTKLKQNSKIKSLKQWEEKPLGEVATFYNGKAYKQSELLSKGKYKVLRVGNFFTKDDWYYSDLELEEEKYVENGDLMYAWSASFGPRFWNGDKTIYHYHIWKVVPNKSISKEFLYYSLLFDVDNILKSKQGGTMAHVTKGDIEKRKILLPSFKEQIKIAKVLSAFDTAVNKLTSLIKAKERRKTGLIQNLLTGEVRFKEFKREKWREMTLGEVCNLVIDGTHQTPKYQDSGIPFYSVENITKDDFKNTKYISEEEHFSLTKRCRIEKGDILMTRIGSIGDAKLIDWNVNASFYVSLALLKIKNNYSSSFIYQLIKTEYFQKELYSRALLSAVPLKINLGEIEHAKIKIPLNIKEQNKIASVLFACDKEIQSLKAKLQKLQKQKQGLMQELLTGKRRVKA